MPDKDATQPDWWVVPQRGGTQGKAASLRLPEPFFNRYKDPDRYDPGAALIAAVNVALILGQPLLLTGEPGSGKTRLAYWLAAQMGLGDPLVQAVKSTTSGKDLLYSFDELARFRDAQSGASRPQQEYLEFGALGRAILFSGGRERRLKRDAGRSESPPTRDAGSALDTGALPQTHGALFSGDFPPAQRQVVLIDELDKAPRDTPNDLLTEIEGMEFPIPELGVRVMGDTENLPVVVITSNSDKGLPEPFLRRCVYHHIPPADDRRRREIVERQQPKLMVKESPLYDQAMEMFDTLHEAIGREGRRPGTAELLAWLDAIDAVYPPDCKVLRDDKIALAVTIKTLAKTADDVKLIARVLELDPSLVGLG